jgi:hypothetical protein
VPPKNLVKQGQPGKRGTPGKDAKPTGKPDVKKPVDVMPAASKPDSVKPTASKPDSGKLLDGSPGPGYKFHDDGWFKPGPPPLRRLRPVPDIPVDDGGFYSPVVKPQKKPAPVKTPEPEFQFDDAGMPIYPVSQVAPLGETKMATATASAPAGDSAITGYASMIDRSTPESLHNSLREAADTARRDGQEMTEKADELRATAAGLEDKPGMKGAAENFLREASALDETALTRLGMATAFDERADRVAAERAS